MTGQAYPAVRPDDVATYPVALPPLDEQRGIAAVLDAIDEAIERSEAVIAATEELRRSLLHELLSRGVPGWHSEWREVRGLGVVPACWEVVRLGEVCERPEYGAGALGDGHSIPRCPAMSASPTSPTMAGSEPGDARSADPSEVDGYELESGRSAVRAEWGNRRQDVLAPAVGRTVRLRGVSDPIPSAV